MMDEWPTVSIVTPSYNQGPYIGATIDSVLGQDYPHLRYLVMDGGSTDRTLEVLRGYGGRIEWISQPDEGQADAINRGFARAGGDVLTWLNSDDTLEPGAVRAAAEYLRAHPHVAVVYGDANFIDPRGRWIGRCAHVERFDRRRLLHVSDFIVQPAAFFRRSAFEAVGGLDKSLHWSMDYDLWLKLAAAGFRMAYIPKVLANYRWFGANKSAVGGLKRIEEVERVARRHGAPHLPAYFCLEAVLAHATQAAAALRQGRLRDGAGAARRALAAVTGSRDAMASLLDPHTWQIIWTGQVLRRRTRLGGGDHARRGAKWAW
jgi:glycosyltransferase involved in cell wall biosynthesis